MQMKKTITYQQRYLEVLKSNKNNEKFAFINAYI